MQKNVCRFFFKEIFKELKWDLVGVEYSKACTCACVIPFIGTWALEALDSCYVV